MRWTFRTKIFGLALMLAVIGISFYGFADDAKKADKEDRPKSEKAETSDKKKEKSKSDEKKDEKEEEKEEEEKTVGTHVEVDPIKIPLGNRGKITTMAMNRDGNLLIGISWVPEGTKPRKPPAEEKPDPPKKKEEESDDPKDGEKSKSPKEKEQGNDEKSEKKTGDKGKNDKPESEKKDSTRVLTMEEIRELPPADRRKAMMERRRKMGGKGGRKKKKVDPYEGLYHYALKIVSPVGKVLESIKMDEGIEPHLIYGASDGIIYVAGGGKLAAFRDGKQVKTIDTKKIAGDKSLLGGLAVDEDPKGKRQIFVAFGTGRSLRATEDIIRFDRGFTNPKKIIEEQFGCCGHLDLKIKDGELLVAENSRHRVNRFDFEGELIERWGERDRTSIEGFAACCNPSTTDFGPKGVLYTAESGVGRVKKFSRKGKYLGFVGYVDTTEFDKGSGTAAQSCYMPIEVAADGVRIYVMDVREHIVRVLEKRKDKPSKVASTK